MHAAHRVEQGGSRANLEGSNVSAAAKSVLPPDLLLTFPACSFPNVLKCHTNPESVKQLCKDKRGTSHSTHFWSFLYRDATFDNCLQFRATIYNFKLQDKLAAAVGCGVFGRDTHLVRL